MPQQYPDDSRQAGGGLYEDGYPITNEYRFDPGVCALPVAEDPTDDPTWSPVVICRLHSPYRVRTVAYRGSKNSTPPVAPAPESAGRFTFLSGALSISNAPNATFQNFDWTVNADYVFVETCVSRKEDGFVLGSPPFLYAPTAENAAAAGYGSPQYGAVAAAGKAARLGYLMGNLATPGGDLAVNWGYNEPSFYPGNFLNSGLVNSITSSDSA